MTETISERVETLYEDADSFEILITGKVGVGKSTLVNALLGVSTPIAVECPDIGQRGTRHVQSHTETVNGVRVKIWDCPGLQDGTPDQEGYLQQMQDRCNPDLIIFCIKSGGETRFLNKHDNKDLLAMKQLAQKFGTGFWKKVVIVLTCTNTLKWFNVKWKNLSSAEVAQEFEGKIMEWKEQVRNCLREQVHLSSEDSESIKIVTAGHYTEADLPGIENWLSVAWAECFQAVSSDHNRAALTKLSEPRIKNGVLNLRTILGALHIIVEYGEELVDLGKRGVSLATSVAAGAAALRTASGFALDLASFGATTITGFSSEALIGGTITGLGIGSGTLVVGVGTGLLMCYFASK